MASELKSSDYQTLLNSISHIYSQARAEAQRSMNHILVQAYWRIGQRIVQVEQNNKFRAEYGQRLLERLSEDLTAQHGKGFSPTNLRRMRLFFAAYPIQPALVKLDWTHYQILSVVEDPQKRDVYEKKSVKAGWSSRELNERLKQDAIAKIPVSAVPAGSRTKAKKVLPRETAVPRLPLRRGKLYTCRVIVSPQVIPSKNHIIIDFGFDVWREVPSTLRNVKNKQIVEISISSNVFKGIASTRTRKDLYFYKAYVERVVDGDTLLVNIDAGPGVWIRQRLRLKGIDAPELSTKAGIKAKSFLQDVLRNIPFITLRTSQIDMYHRYLADVFYLPGEIDPHRVATEGKFLNQELLDVGVVKAVRKNSQ